MVGQSQGSIERLGVKRLSIRAENTESQFCLEPFWIVPIADCIVNYFSKILIFSLCSEMVREVML